MLLRSRFKCTSALVGLAAGPDLRQCAHPFSTDGDKIDFGMKPTYI